MFFYISIQITLQYHLTRNYSYMFKRICSIVLVAFSFVSTVTAQNKQFKALLVTETAGWNHESIPDGIAAMKELANRNHFDLQWHQEASKITDKLLEGFQVIIFLNTTGDIFDSTEQKAIEKFIQSGKGFVGIHSASDTEYGWDWYTKLVGRMFYLHPPTQTAKLNVTVNSFPGLQGFAGSPWWTDEWYEFGEEKVKDLTYILSVDESTYKPDAKNATKTARGMGSFHPIAWYHHYDGGRSFYTALGHVPAVYKEQAFLNHIYAGIFWAATGRK
jgi:uncharacterized protein